MDEEEDLDVAFRECWTALSSTEKRKMKAWLDRLKELHALCEQEKAPFLGVVAEIERKYASKIALHHLQIDYVLDTPAPPVVESPC